ncbi:MAG TPA: metallophosphoesterase [Phycisphaerae bacterium]|nr:metallophosphoesterase [Phycisphaerae bacterium]
MNRREFLLATLASGLVPGLGCGTGTDAGIELPSSESAGIDLTGLIRLARFAQISDTHVVDTESPARFAQAQFITRGAWRPWEAYATQIVDGMIRTVNRIHASGRPVDFLLHTGDGCDNTQSNELGWLLGILDGASINPLSGPDDRPESARPAPTMDPYAPFPAAGLYRTGVHGELPSIPWYALSGNHDSFALGTLPFFDQLFGGRIAPLPLPRRPGLLLPVVLDPTASTAYGNVTPNDPGPPCILEIPHYIQPNPNRAFFNKPDFVKAMFNTVTGPAGHGMSDPNGPTWYSVSPAPGLRLIGLDTADPALKLPTFIYSEGAISAAQADFLRTELAAARDRNEVVIVATHHPSDSLQPTLGSALTPEAFRSLLNEHANVVLHVCGHTHRNRVTDRGGYLEIETCSTIDLPQEGRLIEVYRNDQTGETAVTYEMFSHIDDVLPPLGDDPLRDLRAAAMAIAAADPGASIRQKLYDESGSDPKGRQVDRAAVKRMR